MNKTNICPSFKCDTVVSVDEDKTFICSSCSLEGRYLTDDLIWDQQDKVILLNK